VSWEPISAIVRILEPHTTTAATGTAGTGFLVAGDEDALIATCAHVIRDNAAARPGDLVQVEFRSQEHGTALATLQARVEPQYWREPEAEDIAFLHPIGPVPTGVPPLTLATMVNARRPHKAWGFPVAKATSGLAAEITRFAPATEGGFPALSARSEEASYGFSGAPVWDYDADVVIGMVMSIIPRGVDPAGRQETTVFLRPTEELWRVCPALRSAGENPYRGLDVFEEEHADVYFGRSDAIKKLLRRLGESDFVAVVGVSGSGKSSLVRAGLRKGLDATPILGVAGKPRCRFRPGASPLLDLILAVRDSAAPDGIESALGLAPGVLDGGEEARRGVVDQLERRPAADLAQVVRQGLRRGVIVIGDQFERLFTECREPTSRQRFVDVLIALASEDVKVIVTLRADFYGRALETAGLGPAVEGGQITVLPMIEEELLETVVRPARARHRALEPGLPERLVADVLGRAGDLPLLQLALTELWERDAATGLLRTRTYQDLGAVGPAGRAFPGVRGAIARRAEQVWATLAPDEQHAATRIFLNLVAPANLGDQGDGVVAVAARRAWQLEWDEATQAVADKLVHARLLTSGQDAVTGAPTIEVAHEALIRAWPRLQRLASDQAEFVAWYDRDFAPWLHRWDQQGRSSDLLLRGALLHASQRWLARSPEFLSGTAAEFIAASKDRERNELETVRRRNRRLITLAGLLAVALIIVGVMAITLRQQRQTAQLQRNIATSRQLAAYANAEVDRAPQLAALLSLVALQVHDTSEARGSILNQLEHRQAVQGFLNGPAPSVNTIALSPDGRALASGSDDHNVILWNVARRTQLATLSGHTGPVSNVVFSPDGHTLASASGDKTIILWDVARRTRLDTLSGHAGGVVSVAFSPDGHTLASGSEDHKVFLWDVARRRRLATLSGHTNSVFDVAFSPDGHTLASGGYDDKVFLWDVARRRRLATLSGHTNTVFDVAFSPDGHTLASASHDDKVILWNVARRTRLATLSANTGGVFAVAFSPHPGLLASGGVNGKITLWDVTRRSPRTTLAGHTSAVASLTFSPDGRTLASGGFDGQIMLWDPTGHASFGTVWHGHTDLVADVAFSPDGHIVASGSDDGDVILWDAARRTRLATLTSHTGGVGSVAFSPDGHILAATDGDKNIILWDAARRTQLATLTGHTGAVRSVAFSPDGHTLASGSDDDETILWDAARHTRLATLTSHNGAVYDVAFSPDGHTLAAATEYLDVILWDVARRTQLATLTGHTGAVYSVAFSPDGHTLASGDLDHKIILWDAVRHTRLATLIGHTGAVRSVAFSLDGHTLASGSDDDEIILWDAARRIRLATMTAHTLGVNSITLGPDGRSLASGGENHNVVLWDLDVASWRQRLCAIVGRDLTRDEWATYVPGHKYRSTCSQ